TNNEAVIYPVDSEGRPGIPEKYRKPTVSYTVEKETPVTPIVPSYTRLTVQKVWKLDDGGTAADSVKVQLTRNGIPYGEIKTLSADEGWTADWYVETGYSYDVVELDVPEGFTSSVEKAGYTFTVTNDDVKAAEPEQPDEPAAPDEPDTPDTPDEPQKPAQPEADDADTDAPQTGDAQDMGLWFVLLAVTAGGLGVTLRLSRKQR
ncbi:MAG: Cna B-type domain-containing protein, partial [Emergencia sp.]